MYRWYKPTRASLISCVCFQVVYVAVSDTLGDIATVCYDKNKDCILRLHTINATLVSTVTVPEQITALCFSTAPEGVSVNVIATGHSNGLIR